jgi:5'-3' exonuclease
VRVHLLDGTYELFRHYFAVPKHQTKDGAEVGALRGVLNSVLWMFDEGATHLAVATDHVIESFRNELYRGYKTSAGIEKDLLSQFWPLEDALRAMGVTVWAMTDLEADDALASGAVLAAKDERVEQVLICTPDKDMGQCVVGDHVVQYDRRKRELRNDDGVFDKFGVVPASIPDYLALVGDTADGFPGLQGWGAKSAAKVIAHYGRIEDIPDDVAEWKVALRGAGMLANTLRDNRELAMLFKDLATLRTDAELFTDVDELAWAGPVPSFGDLCDVLDAPEIATRAEKLAAKLGAG